MAPEENRQSTSGYYYVSLALPSMSVKKRVTVPEGRGIYISFNANAMACSVGIVLPSAMKSATSTHTRPLTNIKRSRWSDEGAWIAMVILGRG